MQYGYTDKVWDQRPATGRASNWHVEGKPRTKEPAPPAGPPPHAHGIPMRGVVAPPPTGAGAYAWPGGAVGGTAGGGGMEYMNIEWLL